MSVLEQQQHDLRMKIDGLCKSIRTEINPVLTEIPEMNIPLAAQQMDDLVTAQAELLSISSKIDQLKKELGLG